MESSRGNGANADGTTATVGSVIGDTYILERVLGRGGMGTVFLASHKRLPGKQVAIKMLHVDADDARNKEVLDRFRHEAEITSTLGHPNIVKVDDFNELPDGTPYLVLEYLEGETLAHRLRAGPLAVDQVMSIVRQVGSALAAAHRAGIVHRDLKPHNIFLVPTEVDGELIEIAKVLDFGISKIKGSQTIKTQDNALLGTPQYMSPEQATGQHALVDERTDVFAFGSIVYEMLSGRPAFTGASIPEVVFKVVYEEPVALVDSEATREIAAAVAHAMAKPPDARFSTVNEFVEALTGQVVPAPRVASIPPSDVTAGKVANPEAFAHTMDSSNGERRIVRTQSRAASPVASTIVSQSSRATPRGERAPRSTGLLVAIGVAGATVAAGAVYLVMRSGPAPRVATDASLWTPDARRYAALPDAAPSLDAASPDAAPPDAAIVHPDAAVVHAPHDAARAVATQAIPPELLTLLAQARAALARGDRSETIRLTNQVINRIDASEAASLRARVIRVILRCSESDQSAAEAEARGTDHAADAEITAACAKYQMEIHY